MPAFKASSKAVETAAARASFARKRSFLESGAAWPDEQPPECIETHASLIFLLQNRVWKLKKPVLLSHIDLRTLRARAHFCREELRLNRELAGDIYCGLSPLTERADGSLALGGNGRTVDWLVEMVRLPAEAMLDHRLRLGPAPRPEEIEAVCKVMINFYRTRHRHLDAGGLYYHRLLRESRINAAHLREMRGKLGGAVRDEVLDHGTSGLRTCRTEILARGSEGIVVEGHGDLRAEHVCLTSPPILFDRVEFDNGIRMIDPFDEFNALGLECMLAGADWIGSFLLSRLEQSGMAPPTPALLAVYGVNRCLTRARLAIDHLRDAEIRTPKKWPAQARLYLAAAAKIFDETRKAGIPK